jgi:hypothetical protein
MHTTLLAALGVTLQASLAAAQTQVTVNAGTTCQVIDGFGFGSGVENAPSAQQTQDLNYMFSTTEGAGMTILRNCIAADAGGTIEPNSPGSPSATPSYSAIGDDSSQVGDIYGLALFLPYMRGPFTDICWLSDRSLVPESSGNGSQVHLCRRLVRTWFHEDKRQLRMFATCPIFVSKY